MKTQSMTIKEFMNKGPEPSIKEKVEVHFRKYGTVYKVAGIGLIILASGSTVFAAGSIDVEAGKLYKQLVSVGRWIIAFKGAIEIIKSLSQGDFEAGKKTFFSYLMVYLLLLGLPYGLDKVDQVFAEVHK